MTLSSKTLKQIDAAVRAYKDEFPKFEADAANLQTRLLTNAELRSLVHSFKSRAKDPLHLKDKLIRKATAAHSRDEPFTITDKSIFDDVVDLAGVRLLHLHMRQMERIHPHLMQVLEDEGYIVARAPEAKTWDPEYEQMFKKLGVDVTRDDSMYTSVHYVIKQNQTTRRLCELQVRTLAEEIWGEISHTINYPHPTGSLPCKEQIKALARVVSGCSRLVDSIVASQAEFMAQGFSGRRLTAPDVASDAGVARASRRSPRRRRTSSSTS